MEEDGELRARSFRSEDYNNNRRLFLRSYPLQWEDEEEVVEKEEVGGKAAATAGKVTLKHRLISVFHLGDGKFLLLRKLKNKVAFYLVACNPLGFNEPSDKLLHA